MSGLTIAQPDITLLLDAEGVIREVALSSTLAAGAEGVEEAWVGRPWGETVLDVGGEKVRRMIEDARATGVAGFRQVTQRFPGGLELPVEYAAVRLGEDGGLVAVGKSLQAVADLQERLIAAQRAMERDYWKLRDVETRYRLLLDASTEAVLLVRASDLRVLEANPAAIGALGLVPSGRELTAELEPRERGPFRAMLERARERGKAPAVLVRLGPGREPWLVRASPMLAGAESAFLLQLVPAGAPVAAAVTAAAAAEAPDPGAAAVDDLIERAPDGFAVLDRDGTVLRANRAFLDLVEAAGPGQVVGQRLGRWLQRPGADQGVLLATLRRHGSVRLMATALQGELGGETEVEISAGIGEGGATVGVLLRDVGSRSVATAPDGAAAAPGSGPRGLGATLDQITRQVGRTPLRALVERTTSAVERHYIEAALELTGGNRTAAAEVLGLSRQSLYAKLGRYGLGGGPADAAPPAAPAGGGGAAARPAARNA